MSEYAIVVEETPRNFSAYAPDLPGCVATGATREEAVRDMRAAVAFHIESLREHDEPIPGIPTHPHGCGPSAG